jgi:hypothetical protein
LHPRFVAPEQLHPRQHDPVESRRHARLVARAPAEHSDAAREVVYTRDMALASLPTRARAAHVSPSPLVRAAIALNVWCLVEPAVGLVWQWALSRSLETDLAAHHRVLLGTSLWLVYSADRWLDAQPGRHPATARHAFWARHRDSLAMVWCGVLVASLVLASETLSATEWSLGGVLVGLVGTYLWGVHRLGLAGGFKKAAVAVIYGLGVGVFLWPAALEPARLVAGQVALAALAGCNLAAVAAFERGGAPRRRQRVALWALLFAALLFCVSALLPEAPRALLLGILGSLVVLAGLVSWPNRIDPELAHALCDLALLAPLLPWL